MRIIICVLFVVISVTQSGCWDQRMLKDTSLVMGEGADLLKDGKIRMHYALQTKEKKIHVVETIGNTIRDATIKTSPKTYGTIDITQNRLFLIGENAAKKGLLPIISVFYYDPRNALNQKVAFVRGEAKRIFQLGEKNAPLVKLEEIDSIIRGEENVTAAPRVDLQSIFPLLVGNAQDIMIPMIDVMKQNVVVTGTALFNKDKFVGNIDREETVLLLLMKDDLKSTASLNIHFGEGKTPENYLTINVLDAKPKISLNSDMTQIKVDLSLNLKVNLIEYPLEKLVTGSNQEKLNNKMSKILTSEMGELLKKLQRMNADPLGIGLLVKSKYPTEWECLNWKETYPKIKMTQKVQVEITRHGIIE